LGSKNVRYFLEKVSDYQLLKKVKLHGVTAGLHGNQLDVVHTKKNLERNG
jgi:hypothetical protein